MGIIDGVTTNPSLIIKQKISFPKIIKEMSSILPHPVITETVSTDAQDIVNEAKTLSDIASNVIVGIPVIPEGLKAIKMLKKEHIKITRFGGCGTFFLVLTIYLFFLKEIDKKL